MKNEPHFIFPTFNDQIHIVVQYIDIFQRMLHFNKKQSYGICFDWELGSVVITDPGDQFLCPPVVAQTRPTVQITFIFIDFRVCDFAFAFKTQNAPCVSRFKRILFSDRFQFAF